MGRLAGCEPVLDPSRETFLARALSEAFSGPLRGYASTMVVELGLGRRFLYLVTETGHLGIAYAPLGEPIPVRLLETMRLGEFTRYAWQHPVATAAALAAANAATAMAIGDGLFEPVWSGDIAGSLGVGEGWRVALVGYIPGVAAAIRERGAAITVYEDNPIHRREAEREGGYTTKPGSQLLLEAASYDAVIATGASLLDPRLYTAYMLAEKRPLLALVGPTSSFHPAVAERLGAVLVAGSYVPPENAAALLKLVKAGYGFRVVKRYVRKWLWVAPREGEPGEGGQ